MVKILYFTENHLPFFVSLPKPKAAENEESHRYTHSCSAVLEFSNDDTAIQINKQTNEQNVVSIGSIQ